MAEPDLKRLVADHKLSRLLTEREAEILRRAARSHGLRGIANLYGYSEEQAAAEVQRIRQKLQQGLNGHAAVPSAANSKVAPGPASTPPRAQAPGPAEGSTRVPGGPSREERVRAFLRDHSSATVKDMEATGLVRSSLYEVVRELVRKGEIHETGKAGRSSRYSLTAPKERLQEAGVVSRETASPAPTLPPPFAGVDPELLTLPTVDPKAIMRTLGVSGSVVAPPRVFIGLWDVLLADGADWTAEHTHAYVAAARALYAAYGGD